MVQALLVFDSALGVDVHAMAEEWANDQEAQQYLAGTPQGRRAPAAAYDLSVLTDVVLPLATNVASTVLIAIAVRLYKKVRGLKDDVPVEASPKELPGGGTVIVIIERQPTGQPNS